MTKPKKTEATESELIYDLYAKLFGKYNAPGIDKIIYVQKLPNATFSIKLGGKELTGERLKNLQSEAAFLSKSQIWAVLSETLKNAAHQYMFTQMKTLEDSHYGKTLLYNISVMETVLRGLEKPQVNRPARPLSTGAPLM